MERGLFDQWFDENIDSWITKNIEEAPPIGSDESSDIGDFFREIGFGLDALKIFLDEHDWELSLSSSYGLLATAIEFAIDSGWLEQEDQWAEIMDLFFTRSSEFIGDSRRVKFTAGFPPSPELLKIVEYIIHSFELKSESYSADEFTIDEKVQMIRSTLIGLRNNRYIKNTPLLSALFSTLATDWRVLGGGFGSNMGSGSKPWSYGG